MSQSSRKLPVNPKLIENHFAAATAPARSSQEDDWEEVRPVVGETKDAERTPNSYPNEIALSDAESDEEEEGQAKMFPNEIALSDAEPDSSGEFPLIEAPAHRLMQRPAPHYPMLQYSNAQKAPQNIENKSNIPSAIPRK